MKIHSIDNSGITIQANMNLAGDYKRVLKIVGIMTDNNWLDVVEIDERCGYVSLSAVWYKGQAQEIRDEYIAAKREIV